LRIEALGRELEGLRALEAELSSGKAVDKPAPVAETPPVKPTPAAGEPAVRAMLREELASIERNGHRGVKAETFRALMAAIPEDERGGFEDYCVERYSIGASRAEIGDVRAYMDSVVAKAARDYPAHAETRAMLGRAAKRGRRPYDDDDDDDYNMDEIEKMLFGENG
jgi:hypothetical protein